MNGCRCALIASFIVFMVCPAATAQVTLLGVQYRPDQAFPEHECFWHYDQLPGPCGPSAPMGASLHVFLHNTGASSVTIQDVTLADQSLNTVLVVQEQSGDRHPASIWFADLEPDELQSLLDAGEPVWYKSDPTMIAPGSVGQVVVRLRQVPVIPSVDLVVIHSDGFIATSVPIDSGQPRLVGVGFSTDLATATLYWRRGDGTAPTTVRLDGTDVTARATTVNDSALELAVSVLRLAQPLTAGSFHVFQGVYSDGQTASAGLRAWANKFIYGTWGAQPGPDGDPYAGRAWIDDATNHSVNALVVSGGSGALDTLLGTPLGRQYAEDHDYGFVISYDGQFACHTPLMWFIRDEPDVPDYYTSGVPSGKKVGSMAMMCIKHGEEDLRPAYPAAPTTLNIDSTYRSYNMYNYGQVPDVLMIDPYYQVQLRLALWNYPERIPLYSKATFIYAISQLAHSTCAPNPLHVVLYSCEWVDNSPGVTFPFPTPESKRIEVYYALAGGARGLSYWWYLPGGNSNGLGAGGPEAEALWHEIGLLGAEIRTAAPLLVTSCPAPLAIETSAGLWARSLLVGADTVMLLAVNDQYSNDEEGCHYTPLADASLAVTLPAWITSPSAFEITAGGISDVSAQTMGNRLQVELGTVDLTRMIVVTADPQLKATMQQRYQVEVWPRVCAMAPKYCAPPESPPIIRRQPLPQDVALGGRVTFSLFAIGSGTLRYQWQKDQSNLIDDGHYSGTTTDTLMISDVNGDDLGSYRCVVTNAYGTETSEPAPLTMVAPVFAEIEPLPGETTISITGISADGSVVCGASGRRA
ncbi:MAG: immunoglobulin domain-containing protein, partial [Phycisphaerae bacterium]